MEKIKFFVVDDDKLCYVDPRQSYNAGILSAKASSVFKPLDGPINIAFRKMRPATIADFDDFRVLFSQWPADEYELPIC